MQDVKSGTDRTVGHDMGES